MKKYLKVFALSILLVAMASCNDNPSNSSSSLGQTSNSSISNSSGNPSLPPIETWSAQAQEDMKTVIGEVLPFVKLKEGYESTILTDDTGDYVSIHDSSSENLVSNYGSILEEAGFTADGSETDTEYGYTVYYYVKGNIVVQYDYFPGYGEYVAGNEIFTWIEGGTSGGDQEDVPQTSLTDWPDEVKEELNTRFGTVIPFVALAENFTYAYDEENEMYSIYDETLTDFVSDYASVLEEDGFELAEFNQDYGYDIYVYFKSLNADYNLVVQFYFMPQNDYYNAGNEIDIYLSHKPVESAEWPLEAIKEVVPNYVDGIPSFEVVGNYFYNYVNGGLVIYGEVNEDITNAYVQSAKDNGLLAGETLDLSTWDYIDCLYDWEETFMVLYSYNETEFMISISPSQASYDSLEKTFPTDTIVAFLGAEATAVPEFACLEGSTYKVTHMDAYPVFEINESLTINAIDNGTIGTDSLEDLYCAVLEGLGWTVDDSNYEEVGIVAVPEAQDVKLTFYTLNGIFTLSIEKNSSTVVVGGNEIDLTSATQIVTNSASLVEFSSDNLTVSIDKGSSSTNANNYLGGAYAHTRVYKGQTITFTSENELTVIVIECTANEYANYFLEMTAENCSVTVDGTTVTITPNDGVTSCSLDTSSMSGKHVRINSITM